MTSLSLALLLTVFASPPLARDAEDDDPEAIPASAPEPARPLPWLSATAVMGPGVITAVPGFFYSQAGLDAQWWISSWAALGAHGGWFGPLDSNLGRHSAYGIAATVGARLPVTPPGRAVRMCLVADVGYGVGHFEHEVATFSGATSEDPWGELTDYELYQGRASYLAGAGGIMVYFRHLQIGHVWRFDHVGRISMISANLVVGVAL